MISDDAGPAFQKARLKLEDHEHVFRHVIFAADAASRRGDEAEARVVMGMSEHHHRAAPELPALFEPCAYERGADALALVAGNHGHWRQTHQVEIGVPRE